MLVRCLLPFTIFAAACGDPAATNDVDAEVELDASAEVDAGSEVEAFVAFQAARDHGSCERSLRCDAPSVYASVAECLEARAAAIGVQAARMVDAVARGTVAFDQALAPACLDALAGTCDRPGWEVLGLCAQPTEGT